MAHVYFIAASLAGLTKIGFTSHPVEHRLKALRAGSPVPLELVAWGVGGREYERAFHEMFAASWSHGEWFRNTLDLIGLRDAIGIDGDLKTVIDPAEYPRGIFIAHVMAGVDSERVRALDPNYVPTWVAKA